MTVGLQIQLSGAVLRFPRLMLWATVALSQNYCPLPMGHSPPLAARGKPVQSQGSLRETLLAHSLAECISSLLEKSVFAWNPSSLRQLSSWCLAGPWWGRGWGFWSWPFAVCLFTPSASFPLSVFFFLLSSPVLFVQYIQSLSLSLWKAKVRLLCGRWALFPKTCQAALGPCKAHGGGGEKCNSGTLALGLLSRGCTQRARECG